MNTSVCTPTKFAAGRESYSMGSEYDPAQADLNPICIFRWIASVVTLAFSCFLLIEILCEIRRKSTNTAS